MGDSYDEYTISKYAPYISCIKINGVPILPPLMTEEYRQEMLHYKQMAMAVERKMFDYKFSMDETTINSNIIPSDSEEWGDGTNISNISYKSDQKHDLSSQQFDRPYYDAQPKFDHFENNEFESMNSQVTVIDNDKSSNSQSTNKKIEVISPEKITNSNKTEDKFQKPMLKSTPKKETENYDVQIVKTFNMSKCSIIDKPKSVRKDVSKVDLSKSKHNAKMSMPVKSVKKKSISSKKDNMLCIKGTSLLKKSNSEQKKVQRNILSTKNKITLSPSKNITGSLNNISSGLASPPKIFRQNSYTLEYPSPLLLAHLEEQSLASGVDLHSISMSESTSTSYLCNSSKQKSWEATPKETWSSIGSDINSISMNENSEATLSTKENIKNSSNETLAHLENKSSIINKAETDKTVDNSLHIIERSDKSLKAEPRSDKTEASDYFNQILKRIQEEHEKQLNELKKKQEEEQLSLKNTFENQQKLLLAQFEAMCTENKSIKEGLSNVNNKSNSISEVRTPKAIDNGNEIDFDTEKYLSMSAKVLHKSRSLLNNQNVRSTPKRIGEPLNVDSNCNLKETSKKYNVNNNGNRLITNQYEDEIEDVMTGRTSNTLDDIKTNFTSDTSSVRDTSITDSFVSEYNMNEMDSVSKLKSAFDKITRIQKNFASQPFRDFSASLDDSSKMTKSPNQSISLSSINIREAEPVPYFDRNALSLNLMDIHRPVDRRIQQTNIFRKITQKEIDAATIIVAYAKGYLTRRLMHTDKVESVVQTIRDTLLCALQLHRDEGGIQGADVDLHRRLIQQITAACYTLHDTFITYSPAERMSIIAQDRERRIILTHRSSSSGPSMRQLSSTTQKVLKRKMDRMSRSHTGVFSGRPTKFIHHPFPLHMTRSHYDHTDHIKTGLSDRPRRSTAVAGELVSRKPWR